MAGNANSGRTMTADAETDRLVERLDDARWQLVEAQDALEGVQALLRQAEARLQKVVGVQQQILSTQAAVQRSLGYRVVERQVERVDGLTFSAPIDPITSGR